MEQIKSPGMKLMKIALYIFIAAIVLIIIFSLISGGLQAWHLVMLLGPAVPICGVLAIIGLVMHLNFKTKMQIIQAQAEQHRQP